MYPEDSHIFVPTKTIVPYWVNQNPAQRKSFHALQTHIEVTSGAKTFVFGYGCEPKKQWLSQWLLWWRQFLHKNMSNKKRREWERRQIKTKYGCRRQKIFFVFCSRWLEFFFIFYFPQCRNLTHQGFYIILCIKLRVHGFPIPDSWFRV